MKYSLITFLLFLAFNSKATNLELSQPILYMEDGQAFAVFNISWENAWNNDRNHDAAWLFFKALSKDKPYRHINLQKSGHTVVSVFAEEKVSLDFEVPEDRVGVFIFPKGKFRGTIHATVKVLLDWDSFDGINVRRSSLNVYGVEMVYIPPGGFVLGEPDTTAVKFGSFYKPDGEGKYKELVTINAEEQTLEVSKSGDLFYQSNEGYEGDQQGTIPATFPKGVAPFYMMKYEPGEKEYTDFLNSLSPNQLKNRTINESPNYYEQGGSIKASEGKWLAEVPDKPCQFMSWDDAMAYADWAGLRPMTEFEFTKAARGKQGPSVVQFPWGSSGKEKVQRLPDASGKLVMINGWDESQLNDQNKVYFAASQYWVMDLAGSLWERLISVGHPKGRAFTGQHGDGVLSEDGAATVGDWPTGADDSGGFGFRGGGFYGYSREYHQFNPFSPIAYRPYGGWAGGNRTNSYGTRFVRKATQ